MNKNNASSGPSMELSRTVFVAFIAFLFVVLVLFVVYCSLAALESAAKKVDVLLNSRAAGGSSMLTANPGAAMGMRRASTTARPAGIVATGRRGSSEDLFEGKEASNSEDADKLFDPALVYWWGYMR